MQVTCRLLHTRNMQVTNGALAGYMNVTYRLHTGYIQVTCRLHAGYMQVTCRLHTGYIQVTYRYIQVHTGYIQVTYESHTGYIQVTYRLHTGRIQVTYRLHTGYIQVTYAKIREYTRTYAKIREYTRTYASWVVLRIYTKFFVVLRKRRRKRFYPFLRLMSLGRKPAVPVVPAAAVSVADIVDGHVSYPPPFLKTARRGHGRLYFSPKIVTRHDTTRHG